VAGPVRRHRHLAATVPLKQHPKSRVPLPGTRLFRVLPGGPSRFRGDSVRSANRITPKSGTGYWSPPRPGAHDRGRCIVDAEIIAGRYALCDPIGVGGTGTVWRAFDRERGRFCAAKLLRQRDAGELLRFAREQAVRLTHPRVVSPYAWAADDGMVVIVSELIDGGSLQTLIGDYGPLAEGTVVAVLDQVLDALGAVHAAQLIHRDVKPGNLLLRSGTRLDVLLADFGLTIGVRDARLTQVGTVIGTPGYLPPEVLAGGVPPDVRHDLYAAGRLGLTLLAGGEIDDTRSWLGTIVDPGLRSALAALVATDPAERPASTDAARALLARAVRDAVPHTRDGDPIIVLRQLPDLPAGWSTTEPAVRVASVPVVDRPAVSTRVDDVVTDVVPARPSSDPAAPAVPTGAGAPRTVRAPMSPPQRRRWVGGAVAGVAAVAAAVAIPLLAGSPDGDPVIPTDPDSGTPASTAPVAPGTVEAGASCGWQQEGNRTGTPDGTPLTCTVVDGSYVWSPA
jgi:hypothetical protein